MTEKEYRQHEGISRSQLWKIKESPEKFRYAMENPEEPTPALLFGQMVHKLILEAEDFASDFVVMPEIDKRTKEGKARMGELRGRAAELLEPALVFAGRALFPLPKQLFRLYTHLLRYLLKSEAYLPRASGTRVPPTAQGISPTVFSGSAPARSRPKVRPGPTPQTF